MVIWDRLIKYSIIAETVSTMSSRWWKSCSNYVLFATQKIDGIAHDSVHSNFSLQMVSFYESGDSFSADLMDPLRDTSEARIIFFPLLLQITNSGKIGIASESDHDTVAADDNKGRNRNPSRPSHWINTLAEFTTVSGLLNNCMTRIVLALHCFFNPFNGKKKYYHKFNLS